MGIDVKLGYDRAEKVTSYDAIKHLYLASKAGIGVSAIGCDHFAFNISKETAFVKPGFGIRRVAEEVLTHAFRILESF